MYVYLVEIDHGSYDKNETLGVAASVASGQAMCAWRAAAGDNYGEIPKAPAVLQWRRTPVAGGPPANEYIEQWYADAPSGGVFILTHTLLVGSRTDLGDLP